MPTFKSTAKFPVQLKTTDVEGCCAATLVSGFGFDEDHDQIDLGISREWLAAQIHNHREMWGRSLFIAILNSDQEEAGVGHMLRKIGFKAQKKAVHRPKSYGEGFPTIRTYYLNLSEAKV